MRTRFYFSALAFIALSFLLGAGLVASAQEKTSSTPGATSEPAAQPGANPLAPVSSAFTYQGRLTTNGNPANGQFDLRFTLFNAATAGSQVGSPVTVISQTVTDGLFTVQLDFGATAFQGDARWLELAVKPAGGPTFTVLSPRQALTPAPYAISLMPGAEINGTLGTAVLAASNLGTGSGVYGRGNTGVFGTSPGSGGIGVHGFTDVGLSGVFGVNNGSGAGVRGDSASGWGVHGRSLGAGGTAVYGEATGSSGIGVHGYSGSNTGIGVQGVVSSTNGAVYGNNTGIGFGVFGESTNGGGISGESTSGIGVAGQSSSGVGVYARSFTGLAAVRGTNDGEGYGGFFASNGGPGVHGETLSATSAAVHGVNGLPGPGVSGLSSGGPGVKGFSYGNPGVYGTGSGVGAIGVRAEGDGANTALQIEDGALVVTGTNKPVFVHITTAGNTSGHITYINNPFANGDPNAILIVTPNYNPPGAAGGYNNHPIGVYYDGFQWAIFNQDLAPLSINLGFNVMVVKQ